MWDNHNRVIIAVTTTETNKNSQQKGHVPSSFFFHFPFYPKVILLPFYPVWLEYHQMKYYMFEIPYITCALSKKATFWCGHNDVIKWKHFPRYWPFVWGIHRWPVNSPHKGQWRRALMFSLICAWINGWVNNREAGDLRRNRAHYDVILITSPVSQQS